MIFGGGAAGGKLLQTKKVVAPAVKKNNNKASNRNSGGSSSRRSGGGSSSGAGQRRTKNTGGGSSSRRRSSGGGNTQPRAPKAPAAPKAPSINDYLNTDSTYQQSVRGGKRSLADFLSDLGRRRGEAGTQYGQTKASMERDRDQQLESLRNEFASRGLIQSGLYGQEQGNFQQKFTEQQTALDQQQAALIADLLGQEKNYRRESDLATEQAKQEALLRRSQKYKIGA